MSFAYLTLYTGDYLRDTRHLSCAEHGIYLLLLMHCWDSRGPVPLDERKQAGICGARSGDEVEALRRVLSEFFVRMDDGHYNPRMQREVERAKVLSDTRQRAAFARHKGRDASAMQVHSNCTTVDANTNTTITTNINTTTTTTTPEPLGNKRSKVKNKAQAPFVLPEEIPKMQWDAWIEARTKARKSPTDFAKRLAVSKLLELAERGHHPAAVLAQSAFNGWAGLFPLKENK